MSPCLFLERMSDDQGHYTLRLGFLLKTPNPVRRRLKKRSLERLRTKHSWKTHLDRTGNCTTNISDRKSMFPVLNRCDAKNEMANKHRNNRNLIVNGTNSSLLWTRRIRTLSKPRKKPRLTPKHRDHPFLLNANGFTICCIEKTLPKS